MLFAKLRYTEYMLQFLITLSLIFITQGCELLQKRDIDPNATPDKEERNFKVLSYIFAEQLAVSESSDPTRFIRNQLSSINSATLVATKESSFKVWQAPKMRCLPMNTTDLLMQRIRMNLNMGTMLLKSESTKQEANITAQETSVGTVYGAWGWLPPSFYSFSFSGSSPIMAWTETQIPSLSTGSEIEFWTNNSWQATASPDIDLDASIMISKNEGIKVRYQSPELTNYAVLTLRDPIGNSIRCYGTPNGEIEIENELINEFEVGEGASIELKFVNTRMNLSHAKIDEIYIESSSKHPFGRIYVSEDQALEFGTVQITD
jgi:hypothetical protein